MEPERLVVRNNGQTLVVQWPQGRADSFDAARLWSACPSSRARRQCIDGGLRAAPSGIRITDISTIGLYGVNIGFSDGHDRGIYPWNFLRNLGRGQGGIPETQDLPPKEQGE
jgi:DUF971 family protein